MARILIVDDEPALRESLAVALHKAGHGVTSVGDGQAALEAAEKLPFEVVITDLIMPNVDGLEAIKRFRKTSEHVRIIAMSGGGRTRQFDVLDYARQFGADEAIAKPFRIAELLGLVRKVLGEPALGEPVHGDPGKD